MERFNECNSNSNDSMNATVTVIAMEWLNECSGKWNESMYAIVTVIVTQCNSSGMIQWMQQWDNSMNAVITVIGTEWFHKYNNNNSSNGMIQ